MKPQNILQQARSKQVELFLNDQGQLAFKAPPGALDDGLKQLIRDNKQALIDYLHLYSDVATEVVTADIAAVDLSVRHPLSFAQQRIWFVEQLQPDVSRYNMVMAFDCRGALSVRRLTAALHDIIERYTTLRTRFFSDDDGVWQQVSTSWSFELPETDLTSFDPARQQRFLDDALAQEERHHFDLRQDLLLRGEVFHCSGDRSMLLLNMHHIASDGWSIDLFLDALSAGYSGTLPAKTDALNYVDFARWQQEQQSGADWHRSLDYWVKRLAPLPGLHSLPLDKPRPVKPSLVAGRHVQRLDASLLTQLEQLASQQDATLFMVLQSAFALLLARYANEQHMVMGTPVAGRTMHQLQQEMGLFVNTVVLDNHIQDGQTFSQYLAASRDMVIDAFVHQHVPFEMIVDKLGVDRGLSYTPVFQVLFALQNTDNTPLRLDGLNVELVPSDNLVANFDLFLDIAVDHQGLQLDWVFANDLFESASIAHLADSFSALLQQLVTGADPLLTEINWLSQQTHGLTVQQQNSPQTLKHGSLVDLFTATVGIAGDQIAAVAGSHRMTYEQWDKRSDRLAQYLVWNYGSLKGERIGLCMDKQLDMLVALVAIIKCGGIYVPMDPGYSSERLQAILDDADCNVILTQAEYRGLFTAVNAEKILTDMAVAVNGKHAVSSQDSAVGAVSSINADTPAYMIYTSGSTGKPKGVCMPHRGIVNTLEAQIDAEPLLGQGMRTLQFTSLNFDVSVQEIFSTIHTGGVLYLPAPDVRTDMAKMLGFIQDNYIERIFMPFSVLRLLLAEALALNMELTSLRCIVTAGERLVTGDAFAAFFRRHPKARLVNHYGPSEAFLVTSYALPASVNHWQTVPPIGRPVKNVTGLVMSRDGVAVPPGAIGELYVAGFGLADCYWRDEARTADKFVNLTVNGAKQRFYRTGDLVRWDNKGQLHYVDRADEQIKIRGFRVEPGEIESAIEASGLANKAVVAADKSSDGHARLLAFITGVDNGDAVDEAELRKTLEAVLPGYMVPNRFCLVDVFPMTRNGKVDKKALIAQMPADVSESPVLPSTDTEAILFSLWRELLGGAVTGIHSAFFSVGGHSLLATKLINRINQELALSLGVAVLFEHGTIAALAAHIDELTLASQLTGGQPREQLDSDEELTF